MSYLYVGIEGLELNAQDRALLARPEVGGLVLFKRNFDSVGQLLHLNQTVREIDPSIVICVDQEGGRVQRFGDPCTKLPALGRIGALWAEDQDLALHLAFTHAWLMASEMLALGVDLSFAPVLDRDNGSQVIGDRAFHADPQVVRDLGRAYIKGMHDAGMAATGKHYPGHGSVTPDTHHASARDERELDELTIEDMRPFTALMRDGLDALMLAHVVYPKVDSQPAGFSNYWIDDILRQRSGYEGVIISDDLGMHAALEAGSLQQRIEAAMQAGCDIALVCQPDDVAQLASIELPTAASGRRPELNARKRPIWKEFEHSDARQEVRAQLQDLEE